MTSELHGSNNRRGIVFETLEISQSARLKFAFLTDLRRHLRFDTDFPADVLTECDEHKQVRITNVSRSGIRFEVDRQTALARTAELDRYRLQPDSSTSFDVHFSVPNISSVPVPVHARCKIDDTRHADAEIYQVGMKFMTLAGRGAAFARYLSHRNAAR